jgi:CheY-like chemotaxis protein
VLVVDDNVDAATSFATLLQVGGHDVRTVHSGLEALSTARSFKPEVVFLDIGLPGMSGYEVAKQLRVGPSFKSTVLVAVTGWGSEEHKRQAKEAGFDFHLTKPVDAALIENIFSRLAGVES